MTIITKTAKDGRKIEINKTDEMYRVDVFVDGVKLLRDCALTAVVKGRPEITHVIGGKIGITAAENAAINAAYATEFAAEMEHGRKRQAEYDEYKKAHDFIDRVR